MELKFILEQVMNVQRRNRGRAVLFH